MRDTPIVLLAVVTVVGPVATFGMNFKVVIPPLAAERARQRRRGLRLPDGGLRARLAGGRGRARASAGGRGPIRIALGAIVLGVASVALALLDVVPVVAAC